MKDISQKTSFLIIGVIIMLMVIIPLTFGYVWWEGDPNFVLNETSDFDSGDKFELYNITSTESITNNYHVNENEIQLASKYGDRFNSTATTCDSWKWESAGSLFFANTGGSCDINSTYDSEMYIDNTATQRAVTSNTTVGGDWNITYQASRLIDGALVGIQGIYVRHGTSTVNYTQVYIQKSGVNYQYQAFCNNITNSPNTSTGYIVGSDLADYHVMSVREGDRISNYLKMNETTGWFLTCTNAPMFEYDAHIIIYQQAVILGQLATSFEGVNITADRMNSSIRYDAGIGDYVFDTMDSHLRSGNWTSALQTYVAGEPINRLRINLSADSQNYLDKVEILDSADAVLYSNGNNVVTDGISTFNLPDIEENFKVRVYLAGNGSSTPTIYDIVLDEQEYTSLQALEIDVNDTIFATTDYTEIFTIEFNSTTSESFGMMSSFNIQKLTGGGTSVISARVYTDGVLYHQEDVRTVSINNQPGSTGIEPLAFNFTAGSHNITVSMARTGNGNIQVYNQDYVLGKFNTTADSLIRGQLVNTDYSFNSQMWSSGYNWTINKVTTSPTYHGGKFNIQSTGADHVRLNLTNYNTSATSRNIVRYISGVGEIGSVGIVGLNVNESETHNMTVGSINEDGADITITGALFDFDLRDEDNNLVNHFSEYNESINETYPMIITGDEWQLIDEGFIHMQNGSGIFISTTVSFNSSSLAHTAGFKINVSNSTDGCESNKQRYLSSNNDIGNVYFYVVCNRDLIIGQNYTVHLWGAAGINEVTTETLQIMSEGLTGLEVTNFSLSEPPVSPSINIQEPSSSETQNNLWFNVTTNQGNTDLCWYNIDGNVSYNYTMTNVTGNWYNYTGNISDGIHYVHFYCNNTDGLTGETGDFYFTIGESYDEAAIILGLMIIVMTLMFLASKTDRNELQLLYVCVGLLIMVVAVWSMLSVLEVNSVSSIDDTMSGLFSAVMWLFVFLISYFIIMFIKSVFEQAAELKES